MDQTTFLTQLSALVLFPPEVTRYAGDVCGQLDDAGRKRLLEQLQKIYADYEALEQERASRYQSALSQLIGMKKEYLPAIRAGAEAADDAERIDALNRQLDS